MATEQLYDPNLGGLRDAFPGEVVPPEQQKTLQRLMQEDAKAFRKQFGPVIATGQLTQEEINAIEKAASIRAELRRKGYLEAIRSNPANILQAVLKELDPKNPIIRGALLSLNQNVENINRAVELQRASDQTKGLAIKDTLSYVTDLLSQRTIRSRSLLILNLLDGADFRNNEATALTVIKTLGILPSDALKSFNQWYNAVYEDQKSSFNTDSGRFVRIFSPISKKPGLEGVRGSIDYQATSKQASQVTSQVFEPPSPTSVDIAGTPEVLARIVDKGQYVRYA